MKKALKILALIKLVELVNLLSISSQKFLILIILYLTIEKIVPYIMAIYFRKDHTIEEYTDDCKGGLNFKKFTPNLQNIKGEPTTLSKEKNSDNF